MGAADPRSVSLPPPPGAHAELRTEERRRAVPVMPSVRPSAPQAPRRCCCPRTPSWRRPRRRATACSVRSCSASTSPRCATTTCTAGAPRAARTSPRSCARGVSGARPLGGLSVHPPPPPEGLSVHPPAPPGGLSPPAPAPAPRGPLSTPAPLGSLSAPASPPGVSVHPPPGGLRDPSALLTLRAPLTWRPLGPGQWCPL